MRLIAFLFASVLVLSFPQQVAAEGAWPPPGVAATAVQLGGADEADHAGGGAFVFQNGGGAAVRLLLPSERDHAVACTPDGQGSNRSRVGQYTIAGGAELHCTASPGKHRYTAITAEGGAVHEVEGRLVVR